MQGGLNTLGGRILAVMQVFTNMNSVVATACSCLRRRTSSLQASANPMSGKNTAEPDSRTIDELCAEQSIWLTRLEQRLAEQKRDRNIIISWWYGRRAGNLPSKLVLKSCADEEL